MGFYLGDHLAAGLGSLAVGGPFASECKYSLPGGAILQRELADDAAESRHLDVPDRRGGLTQEQQEGVEPGPQEEEEDERKEQEEKDSTLLSVIVALTFSQTMSNWCRMGLGGAEGRGGAGGEAKGERLGSGEDQEEV